MGIMIHSRAAILFLIVCLISSSKSQSPYNPIELRPRLYMHDGNMIFFAGRDKNITFSKNNGRGSILFDHTDLSSLSNIGDFNFFKRQLEEIRTLHSTLETSLNEKLAALEATAFANQLKNDAMRKTVDDSLTSANASVLAANYRRVFETLQMWMTVDECTSNPCQNAGTCLDLFGSYACICLQYYEGKNCENPINECERYSGTDLGCQNGATCTDLPTGFTCTCTSNFYGTLCTETSAQCGTVTTADGLCGLHGTCVPRSGPPGYSCICDRGWHSPDKGNPTCVDVDECTGDFHCYPGVACVNTPGSFSCAGCPAGYEGNGYHCVDKDECSDPGNGCYSQDWCFNTPGSYKCKCPPGRKGDGKSCNPASPCDANPCASEATCESVPASPIGYRCVCPRGFYGNGIGSDGCKDPCNSPRFQNWCENGGTCVAARGRRNSIHFFGRARCICPPGYSGRRCHRFTNSTDGSHGPFGGRCLHGGTARRCIGYTCKRPWECLCQSMWSGDRCEVELAGCGSTVNSVQSSIGWPNNKSSITERYGTNQRCVWHIETDGGKVLNMTFTKFDIEYDRAGTQENPCRFDNVTLFDGDSEQAPMIGSYCGSSAHEKTHPDKFGKFMITSTNRATVRFMSDSNVIKPGFVLNWTSVDRVCGSEMKIQPQQHIKTTFAPFSQLSQYVGGIHCLWYVEAPPGFVLRFQMGEIKLKKPNDTCSQDYLEFRNGLRAIDPELKKFCRSHEQRVEEPFTSTLNNVRIYLRTVNGTGPVLGSGFFSLEIEVVQLDKSCGGILNDTEGTIQTPGYPANYPANLDCIWILNGSDIYEPGYAELTFTDLDIQPKFGIQSLGYRSQCADYVRILNGATEFDPPAESNVCSGYLPRNSKVVALRGPRMYIHFHSNGDPSTGRGFQANYRLLCGGRLQGTEGTITTPNWPNAAPEIRCMYSLSIARGYVFEVNFTSINLGNHPAMCGDNYIKLHGEPADMYYNDKKICRPTRRSRVSTVGELVYANSGTFDVEFASSGNGANFGFQATYKLIHRSCGGVLFASSGTLSSPILEETGQYMHGLYCRWDIRTRYGQSIKLQFHNWKSLEYHNECRYDYVEIYDSYVNENETGTFYGRYCDSPPPPIFSTGQSLVVIFRTDKSENAAGFAASYTTFSRSTDCSKTYSGEQGDIQSYLYPDAVKNGLLCEFHIISKPGTQILLTFRNFTIDCRDAFLEIRNGPSPESPAITGFEKGQLCGNLGITQFISHGDRLYMKFNVFSADVDRDTTTGPLFNIHYEAYDGGCGRLMSGISETFASPQYPLASVGTYECFWKISVAKGNLVEITIDSVELPAVGNDRCRSYIEVFNGLRKVSNFAEQICSSRSVPTVIVSNGSDVGLVYRQFIFRAKFNIHAVKGFFARYRTVCQNVELVGFDGMLESPGYNSPVNTERNCNWTVSTYIGNQLKLQMVYFKVDTDADDKNCTNNYLKIIDGEQESVYCDSRRMGLLVTKSHLVKFEFVSQTSYPENHFHLVWGTKGCGGLFTDEHGGNLTILNTTGSDEPIHTCYFQLKAPEGKQVALTIKQLAFSGRETWPYGVYVFEGAEELDPSDSMSNSTGPVYIQRNDPTVGVTSYTNQLLVMVKYDRRTMNQAEKLWFLAQYNFEPAQGDTCGTTNASGTIYSPGYQQRHVIMQGPLCRWLITEAPYHTVRLTLDDYESGNYLKTCYGPPQAKGIFGVGSVNPIMMRSSYRKRQRRLTIYDGADEVTSSILFDSCSNSSGSVDFQSSSNQMLIVFRSNPKWPFRQAKGFKAHYRPGCGARLQASYAVQELMSPDFYDHGSDDSCVWTILSADDEIQLLVTSLHLGQCDRLTVYWADPSFRMSIARALNGSEDGMSKSFSHGWENSDQMRPIVSKTGRMTVHLGKVTGCTEPAGTQQLASIGKPKLRAVYHSASVACGGELYLEKMAFTSPQYPEQYPVNVECVWTVHVNPGNRIAVQFFDFNMGGTKGNCAGEYVELRLSDRGGPFVGDGRYCGTYLAGTRVEASGTVWIRFVASSNIERKTGFSMFYEKLKGHMVISGSSGVIASPYFRVPSSISNYVVSSKDANPEQDMVTWRIAIPQTKVFNVTIEDMNLLMTNPGPGGCGKLHSLLVYNSNCRGRDLGYYSALRVRRYTHRIQLSTHDLQRRSPPYYIANPDACLLDTLCGTVYPSQPQERIYEVNLLDLVLPRPVGSSWNDFGFRLRWSAIEAQPNVSSSSTENNQGCGEFTLEAKTQESILTSPRYPVGYDNHLDCKWWLQAPYGHEVQVEMENLDLEVSSACRLDYVQIKSGSNKREILAQSDEESSRLCQRHQFDSPRTFPDNLVLVQFVTDRSIDESGFRLKYKAVCGGRINDRESGLIESPGYSDGLYPASTMCQWVFNAPFGRVFNVQFLDTQFNNFEGCSTEDPCCHDYVSISDGQSLNEKICRSPSSALESTTNYLVVSFHSNEDNARAKGFQMRFVVKGKQCGEMIHLAQDEEDNQSRMLSVPSRNPESSQYQGGLECGWTVVAPPGRKIRLNLQKFQIPTLHSDDETRKRQCGQICGGGVEREIYSPDFIEIYDGATAMSQKIDCLCDSQQFTDGQRSIFSSGRYMFVRLVTHEREMASVCDGEDSCTAIMSVETAKCGGALYSYSGIIQSPGWPQAYEPNTDCDWIVEAPPGHALNFTIQGLQIAGSEGCVEDYLEIRDGGKNGMLVGRYCQANIREMLGKRIATVGRVMYVKFHSNEKENRRGFQLSFMQTKYDCGGEVTVEPGTVKTISTPRYPEAFPAPIVCEWSVSNPSGGGLNVAFNEAFDLGEPRDSDSLLFIYEGDDDPSKLTAESNLLTGPSRVPRNIQIYGSRFKMILKANGSFSGFSMDVSASGRSRCNSNSDHMWQMLESSTPVTVSMYVENATNKYPRGSFCEWGFFNPSGFGQNGSIVLNISDFESAAVGYGSICSEQHGKLKIYTQESITDQKQLYGVRCGNYTGASELIQIPHHYVLVEFQAGTGLETFRGFNLTTNLTDCGGVFRDTQGTISSPNYPEHYEHNLGCAWLLQAPDQYTIALNITNLDVEPNPRCRYDNVTIQNGPYQNSPVIRTLCGQRGTTLSGKLVQSLGNQVQITFKTDHSSSHRGFRIEYQFVAPGSLPDGSLLGCGGTLSGVKGTVVSPGYKTSGHTYPPNKTCVWDINAPAGFLLKFKFKSISIAGIPANCSNDYLNISSYTALDFGLNQPSLLAPLAPPLCGAYPPAPIKSTTNFAELTFVSTGTHADKFAGFELDWYAECGGNYSEEKGWLSSPYYPNARIDMDSANCTYYIWPPGWRQGVRQFVVLQFQDFDMGACDFGEEKGVIISNYKSSPGLRTSNDVQLTLCGTDKPEPRSTDGPMMIQFVTDQNVRGFSAHYHVTSCGGSFNVSSYREEFGDHVHAAQSISFHSPTFPARLHNDLDCVWEVHAAPGFVVGVVFLNISMEYDTSCSYDYIELTDSNSTNHTHNLGKFCGTNIPDKSTKSSSSYLRMHLHTDSSTFSDNFSGFFKETLGEEGGCGGELYVSEGESYQLKSPVSPTDSSGYHHNLFCEWYLRTDPGKIITLDFSKFHLEKARPGDGKCAYDYLEIHDGLGVSPTIGRYCDRNVPSRISSSGRELYIQFVTDGSQTATGFEIDYRANEMMCGGVEDAAVPGVLLPPKRDEGLKPPPNVRCSWFLFSNMTTSSPPQATGGDSLIMINVTKLNIPRRDGRCDDHYIEIRDVSNGSIQVHRLCGSEPGYIFISQSSTVRVTAVVGSDVPDDYDFELAYRLYDACNVNINANGDMGGRIWSPGYPDHYGSDKSCHMSIKAPQGYYIQLYFTAFNMEMSTDCQYDFLEISSPRSGDTDDRSKLCGDVLPPPYPSRGNEVKLFFKTDTSLTHPGFDVTYVVSRDVCGGAIAAASGTIMNPLPVAEISRSLSLPPDVSCRWNISVSSGHGIRITLAELRGAGDCEVRVFQLTAGSEVATFADVYLCSSDLTFPVEKTLLTNKMIITYKPSSGYQTASSEMFRLTFNQTDYITGTTSLRERVLPRLG